MSISKKLFSVTLFFLSFSSFSQIVFEKGYFVEEDGTRSDVLIENKDWKNNPVKITYKSSESSPEKTISIAEVKEFGIDNKLKYLKSTILIDRSSDNVGKLKNDRNPRYSEETVFLKSIVEGTANLYQFQDPEVNKFFFSKEDSGIQPLVYNRYVIKPSVKIHVNNQYQQQLINNLQCPQLKQKDFLNTSYSKKGLTDLFIKYNDCVDGEYTNFSDKEERDVFNLSVRPGVNFTSFKMNNSFQGYTEVDFGNKTSFRMGLEAEYVLPFWKNKWTAFIEPTYQSYEGESIYKERYVAITYKSIEIPLGVRHYIYLNPNHKLFINASYMFDLSLGDSQVVFDTFSDFEIQTDTGTNFSFGAGYNLYNKFSLEARYNLSRNLSDHTMWLSDYNSFSIFLGYNIF